MTGPDDQRGAQPGPPPPPDPNTRLSSGYAAPPAEPGRERDPRAAASLALGIAGLCLFFVGLPPFLLGFGAIVTGAASLLHLRRHPELYGVSIAAAGIVTGILAIFLAAVFIAASDDEERQRFDAITIPYAQLNLGDCHQRPVNLERKIEVRPCAQEHDRQAVGAVEHEASVGAPYPGETVLAGIADERCRAPFTRFVDAPAERDALVADHLVPTEVLWDNGSRHVVCAVARADGARLVGSVNDNSPNLP
ncbi:MAG: septum formation family protein [Acidimicrobiales bacterium]